MAREQPVFYKGEKKKKNLAFIPVVIILFVITMVIVLFYSTQKYAVITEDGVKVELPLFGGGAIVSYSSGNANEPGTSDYVPETTNATIQFDGADYSMIEATAGENVSSVRGIFVPYGDINYEKVEEYANRLSTGNSLMLEVKTENGYMQWYSESAVAKSYATNMNSTESTQTLKSIINMCKDRGIYLVAKISVCRDEVLATHASNVILRDQYGGGLYDENGNYLDPYNQTVRDYTAQIVQELWDMGFDEVALNNVIHPIIENESDVNAITVTYTREMSTTPNAVGAVCGFAVNIAQQLEERSEKKYLSIYVNDPIALARANSQTGQDGRFFLKLFDRVYYDTDMYTYTYNVQDIMPGVTIGNYKDRFVPVVINYLPDNTSWILVDYDED